MATITNEKPYPRGNFSGGEQNKTTKFLKEESNVNKAVNLHFGRIGGLEKVKGMSKLGDAITATSTTTTSTSTSSSTSTSTSSSSTTTA